MNDKKKYMRQFRITYVKKNKFEIGKAQTIPIITAEQIINTDCNGFFDIPVPSGFDILQICEILQPIEILTEIKLKLS